MTKEDISLEHKMDNFLLVYCNSVHATTNQTPAMLFRQLRCRIDLLKSNLRRDVQNKQFSSFSSETVRSFDVGQRVLARDYRGDKWTPGRIVTRSRPLMYEVDTDEHPWRRPCPPDPGPGPDHSTVTPTVAEEVPPSERTPQVPRRNPEQLRAPPKRVDLWVSLWTWRKSFDICQLDNSVAILYITFIM